MTTITGYGLWHIEKKKLITVEYSGDEGPSGDCAIYSFLTISFFPAEKYLQPFFCNTYERAEDIRVNGQKSSGSDYFGEISRNPYKPEELKVVELILTVKDPNDS